MSGLRCLRARADGSKITLVSLWAIAMEKTAAWQFDMFLTESPKTCDVIFSLVLSLITTSVIKHSVPVTISLEASTLKGNMLIWEDFQRTEAKNNNYRRWNRSVNIPNSAALAACNRHVSKVCNTRSLK